MLRAQSAALVLPRLRTGALGAVRTREGNSDHSAETIALMQARLHEHAQAPTNLRRRSEPRVGPYTWANSHGRSARRTSELAAGAELAPELRRSGQSRALA